MELVISNNKHVQVLVRLNAGCRENVHNTVSCIESNWNDHSDWNDYSDWNDHSDWNDYSD